MPNPKPAKKTKPPQVLASATVEASPATTKPPHEPFWEAGRRLFLALHNGGEEARKKLASAHGEQQQHLWDVQNEGHKRAEELRREYCSALNRATGEDRNRLCQEAAQKYHDGLQEIHTNVRKEWETAVANYQETLTSLLEGIEAIRLNSFNGYKADCQKAWSKIDPDTLTSESLATIGQSLLVSARFMGGRPHVS
jgi:hypothetical protein